MSSPTDTFGREPIVFNNALEAKLYALVMAEESVYTCQGSVLRKVEDLATALFPLHGPDDMAAACAAVRRIGLSMHERRLITFERPWSSMEAECPHPTWVHLDMGRAIFERDEQDEIDALEACRGNVVDFPGRPR